MNRADKERADKVKKEREELLAFQKLTHQVQEKAVTESGMVIAQAQRLFYEIWNSGGIKMNVVKGKEHFMKCMEMADEIRKITAEDFKKRLTEAQADFEAEHQGMAPDGISRIITPSADQWANHRMSEPGRMK